MDEDLEFCLLKFAEDQQLLHNNERQEQEKDYLEHISQINQKEETILREQGLIIELFEKELVANRQNSTELKHEIIRQLQEHIHYAEENVKHNIHAREKELAIWSEGKEQERSHISDAEELSKFNQTLETEKALRLKELEDFREAQSKQLQNETDASNINARDLLQTIESSHDENKWLENFQRWCDEKLREQSATKPDNQMKSTESTTTSSRRLLSDDSVKLLSSSISDNTAHKRKLIAEFKERMEDIFKTKEMEFNKNIDQKIQQLNNEKANPEPDAATPGPYRWESVISGVLSYIRGRPSRPPSETTALANVPQQATTIQESTIVADLELAKRQYSEGLERSLKEILSDLEASDIDSIQAKSRRWLKDQNDTHRHRIETSRQEHEEKQAQNLADHQAQTIELICALNQLAINSDSADKFKVKLKDEEKRIAEKYQELKETRMQISVPVIVLDIDDLQVHRLPVCIRFNESFDQWIKDADQNKSQLISSVRKQFNLPGNAFDIITVETGSIVIRAYVHPPHAQNFFQQLLAGHIADIGGHATISITYGNNPGDTHWSGSLDRGRRPYFCPKGWHRFGIKVADTNREFDERWGTWNIAYHGTGSTNASGILRTGLRTGLGCHDKSNPVVYLSPSITYSAHYRYAKPWKNPRKPGKYYQMVFQCRVNPQVVTSDHIVSETMMRPQQVRVDEHFKNDELEWIIYPTNNAERYISENIICYGIMIRVCDGDPDQLPESAWWQHTPYEKSYQRT